MPVMPFHLAFPVTSLDKARAFYGGLLGCPEGRSSPEWVDFDFHGHQIVAHLSPNVGHRDTNPVDGDNVPVRHFGVVLPMDAWKRLADKLKAAGTSSSSSRTSASRARPANRRRCSSSTHAGNAIEFKAFENPAMLFAK